MLVPVITYTKAARKCISSSAFLFSLFHEVNKETKTKYKGLYPKDFPSGKTGTKHLQSTMSTYRKLHYINNYTVFLSLLNNNFTVLKDYVLLGEAYVKGIRKVKR